jgi:hypothetical protein
MEFILAYLKGDSTKKGRTHGHRIPDSTFQEERALNNALISNAPEQQAFGTLIKRFKGIPIPITIKDQDTGRIIQEGKVEHILG